MPAAGRCLRMTASRKSPYPSPIATSSPQLRDGPDVLAFSAPVVGASAGSVIVVARSLRGKDGRFAGVVAIGVKPAALLGSGLPQRTSAAEILTLMSSDGVVPCLARHRNFLGSESIRGRRGTQRRRRLRRRPPSPTDGKLRAHALRRVGGMPLHIAVGDTFDGVEGTTGAAPQRTRDLDRRRGGIAHPPALAGGPYASRRARQLRELAALTTRLERPRMWPVSATGCGTSPRTGCRCPSSSMPCSGLGRPLEPNFEAFVALVPEHEREAMREAFRTLVKDGSVEHEHHVRRPDSGELRCLRQGARVTERGADGRARMAIGTRRDVTEERRTQALLEARERRLDAIIGSLAEGVVVRVTAKAGLPWPTTRRPGSPAWPCRPAWPASRIGRMGDA